MSLAKIPFVLSVVWGMDRSMTPPRPPPSSSERLEVSGNFVEQYIIPSVGLLKKAFWLPGLIETATILASNFPDAPLAPWVLRHLAPPSGWALNLVGTLLRIHCYRKLDRLFTFELAVQKEQKLVTDGVYGIVRHPSYTAVLTACIGCYAAQLCPGSWLYEYAGFAPTAALGTFLMALLTVGIGERILTEDDMLRKGFGEQWEEWAKRVPYRLIPGIL
ncbi:hypothetical protein HDZ31DRAFT_71405 [Schizophyllum fasciatum]